MLCIFPRIFTAIKTQNIIHCFCSEISGSFYNSIFLSFAQVNTENTLYLRQRVLDTGKTGFQKSLRCFRHEMGAYRIRTGKVIVLIQYFVSLKLCPLFTKYILTYFLEQSPSWESKPCQLVKNFLVFYVTGRSIRAFSRTRQLSLSHRPYIKRRPRQLTHWCM